MSRRKIERLRALARSTTFPAERDSANQKADALEAKMLREQAGTADRRQAAWEAFTQRADDLFRQDAAQRQQRKPKSPWRGSPSEHDDLYHEALARLQQQLERDRPNLSPRVREILARKQAMQEMVDRFGLD